MIFFCLQPSPNTTSNQESTPIYDGQKIVPNETFRNQNLTKLTDNDSKEELKRSLTSSVFPSTMTYSSTATTTKEDTPSITTREDTPFVSTREDTPLSVSSVVTTREDTPLPTPAVENKPFEFVPKLVAPITQSFTLSEERPSLVRPPKFDDGCLQNNRLPRNGKISDEITDFSIEKPVCDNNPLRKNGLAWEGQYPWRVPQINNSKVQNGHPYTDVQIEDNNINTPELNNTSTNRADSNIMSPQRPPNNNNNNVAGEFSAHSDQRNFTTEDPSATFNNSYIDTNIPWDLEGTQTIVNNISKPKDETTTDFDAESSICSSLSVPTDITTSISVPTDMSTNNISVANTNLSAPAESISGMCVPTGTVTTISAEALNASQLQHLREENQQLRAALIEVWCQLFLIYLFIKFTLEVLSYDLLSV